MNIKQFYKLKPYEETLFTAKYCDYFRNLTTPARTVLEGIYQELFKEKSNLNVGCGGCQLKSLKKIADAYFTMKEKLSKKENVEEPPVENNIVEDIIEDGKEES